MQPQPRAAAFLLSLCCYLFVAMSPVSALGMDYWHTRGNKILDSQNNPVRIAGVTWSGFEAPDAVVHGLWAQDYKSILKAIRQNGYNSIRIPYSNQMVEANPKPVNISFSNSTGPINTDLQGLTSLEILDKIVDFAGAIGLRVILDNHRSEAGTSAEANGLWYTKEFPEQAWISDWVALARRYRNKPAVVGMDLRNEPHNAGYGGSCWGCGTTANDWRLAAQRAGNAILAMNPRLLIFVEGTDCYKGECYWWGGNLLGAGEFPVVLKVPHRLVYSAHDFGPALFQQKWFTPKTTSASLQAIWIKYWAYIYLSKEAPVWLAEFGTTNKPADIQNTATGSQGQWFSELIQFLGTHQWIHWAYWALNGEDPFGLLDNSYDATPANTSKHLLLSRIQFTSDQKGQRVSRDLKTKSGYNPDRKVCTPIHPRVADP